MAWHIELTARAERDLEQIFQFIHATDSAAAARWFDGLQDAIESHDTLPERSTAADYDPNLRFLLYGNKPHIDRILYRIHGRPDRVIVTHIRHGARRPLAS
jgi:plasmid stabilization system protein ParE